MSSLLAVAFVVVAAPALALGLPADTMPTGGNPINSGKPAQEFVYQGDGGAPAASADEARLLNEVHALDLAQIDEGKVAKGRADAHRVQEYGQELIDDRSEAEQQLQQFARANGTRLQRSLPSALQDDVDNLRAIPFDYDQQLLIDTVNQQARVIDDIRAVRSRVADPAFQQLLDGLLGGLIQDHDDGIAISEGIGQGS